MEIEDQLAYTQVWPAEIKEGVQQEVQVLYLDSASEVDGSRGASDVPLEIGGDQPRLPGKKKMNNGTWR